MLIDNLALFLRIVEKGGLAVAGREMGLSPTTVSERLAALEAYYGATLLNRTTRSINLTSEGQALVEGARRLLSEADELEARIRLGVDKVAGPIRLSAPADLGRSRIAPILDTFLAEHPEVAVDLALTDGYVDLVGQGLDFAIRFGALADSTMKVRKIGDNQRIVCAAPSYVKKYGAPEAPSDLEQHNCLIMRFGQNIDRAWRFTIEGKERIITVHGNRISDDGGLVRKWCLAGHGIALKSIWDVDRDVASGDLVELLPGFTGNASQLQIVYPAAQIMPRRVRMVMDHLEGALRRVLDRSIQAGRSHP